MPSVTTFIEDSSPILHYSPTNEWTFGSSRTDSLAYLYTASSFTLTQSSGAIMSLNFNGSGVGIFGAFRANHGPFKVDMDGVESSRNGTSVEELFNQTLYANTSLTRGSHILKLTNQAANFLDVDYVTIEAQIGDEDEELIVNTFQDTHPAFSFSPSSSWRTPALVSQFSGASGHATQDLSALATMTFDSAGDGIVVYGPVGPSQTTSYAVRIDNGSETTFSAVNGFYRPQQIIFYATNLGRGSHILTMHNTGSGELAIDYAIVYTTPSLGGSFIGVPPTHLVIQLKVPGGLIAALALTTTVALAGILGFCYLFWREVRRGTSKSAGDGQVLEMNTRSFITSNIRNMTLLGGLSRPSQDQPRTYDLPAARPISALNLDWRSSRLGQSNYTSSSRVAGPPAYGNDGPAAL